MILIVLNIKWFKNQPVLFVASDSTIFQICIFMKIRPQNFSLLNEFFTDTITNTKKRFLPGLLPVACQMLTAVLVIVYK